MPVWGMCFLTPADFIRFNVLFPPSWLTVVRESTLWQWLSLQPTNLSTDLPTSQCVSTWCVHVCVCVRVYVSVHVSVDHSLNIDDENRIVLKPISGCSDRQQDYINASYIDVSILNIPRSLMNLKPMSTTVSPLAQRISVMHKHSFSHNIMFSPLRGMQTFASTLLLKVSLCIAKNGCQKPDSDHASIYSYNGYCSLS